MAIVVLFSYPFCMICENMCSYNYWSEIGKNMTTPIDMLESELWSCCVMQRAAKDQQTLEQWQSNELAHLKEGFVVQLMPTNLNPLLREALQQWEQIESKIFARLHMNKEQFLKDFENARQNFLIGNTEWKEFVLPVGDLVCGTVRNMNWVNLFSWVLPAADPKNSEKHSSIGRLITAFFYIESLLKQGDNPETLHGNPLSKIEARWCIVNNIKSTEELVLFSINKIIKQFQNNPFFCYPRMRYNVRYSWNFEIT